MSTSPPWKLAIHEYVRLLSRAEVEQSASVLRPCVLEEGCLQPHAARLRRLRAARGASADREVRRCELRAQLIRVREQQGQAAVRLRLRQTRVHAGGVQDQLVRYEQLMLVERRGRWLISRIAAEAAEKQQAPAEARPEPEPYINRSVLVNRNHAGRHIRYNRELARDYAETWWNSANPRFAHFDVDCTNFVSQCLYAGGIPMNYTGRRNAGWWYEGYDKHAERWSYSWAVANSLHIHLQTSRSGLRAETVDSARQLQIGDVISYDWNGDARYQHTAVVTAFDAAGEPLVNAHTNDSRQRYWDYKDSYAWSEATTYSFLHIPDVL